jgi:hypothetical protein
MEVVRALAFQSLLAWSLLSGNTLTSRASVSGRPGLRCSTLVFTLNGIGIDLCLRDRLKIIEQTSTSWFPYIEIVSLARTMW